MHDMQRRWRKHGNKRGKGHATCKAEGERTRDIDPRGEIRQMVGEGGVKQRKAWMELERKRVKNAAKASKRSRQTGQRH